jgi:hypothetical protein
MTNSRIGALRAASLVAIGGAIGLLALALAMTASAAGPCGICGKNLIKNPGAELGRGVMAVDTKGAVPGWTNAAGQFGAASYAFDFGWFSVKSKGPAKRGKNYFFGGVTREAVDAPASVGKQTIALPAAAVGRKATLSGWLGNYGDNRSQVRAEFMDAAGTVLSTVRIGPSVAIGSIDMGFRTRTGKVPPKTKQVTIVITFAGGSLYKLAAVDEVSLVLT